MSRKVLVFHLGFYFSGGGEKLVLEEIRGLQAAGYEVECFTPILDTKKCFPESIKSYPIRTILPQLPSFVPKRHSVQLLLTCVMFPLLSFRFRHGDVCFAANQPSLYFAYILKKLFNIPYVSYLAQPLRLIHPRDIDREHGLFIRDKSNFLPKLARMFRGVIHYIDQVSTSNSDVLLVNGEHVQKRIQEVYGVEGVVCAAGSHSSRPLPLRARNRGTVTVNRTRITKPYLLITNRHFPQKKFEYGIVSLASLLVDNRDLTLVITGEEMGYTNSLKELVHELGLSQKVLFLGLVRDKHLASLYSNALIYLYTAPEEDFGMGIVEAMAVGTPVVAWDNAGPRFILDEDVGGIRSHAFDIEDFTGKIRSLLLDSKLWRQKSREAYKKAREKYSYSLHNSIIQRSIDLVLEDSNQ